jgi:hypothetical protein
LFSTGFLKGGAEEVESPGVRGETVPFHSNAIIRLFISCTSYKRVDMSVCLIDSPSGRPVLSSCSSYSEKVCRVEPRLSMDFSTTMMVGGGKFIVVMHESSLVLRTDKFGDLIVQLGEMQVERIYHIIISISDIIVFP